MSIQHIRPKVVAILTTPDVDLETISAKRVRKQLIAGGEREDFVKTHKEDIDALIAQIYEEVRQGGVSSGGASSSSGNVKREDYGASSPSTVKRKRSPSPSPVKYAPPSSQPQPLASKKAKHSNGVARSAGTIATDAELARQLSMELNGRSKRAAAPAATTSKSKGGGKKGKRSKPTVDSDGDDDEEYEKPRKSKGGLNKEFMLSPALADLTGETMLSRPQAVKRLWDHIKANNLQNPADKREILCDDKFKAVFRTEKLNMFKMNKILGEHLFQPDD